MEHTLKKWSWKEGEGKKARIGVKEGGLCFLYFAENLSHLLSKFFLPPTSIFVLGARDSNWWNLIKLMLLRNW